jgi:3-deoxy-manno-octulosonate cytidylyltransferase (CMP-KDO synthetase)
MVQGDEPMIHPNMIKESISPILKNKKINVVNLCGKIKDKKEFYDKNCIKTVCSKTNNALYFSRQPIPWSGDTKSYLKKQVCVISFKRNFLIRYVKMKSTTLEELESIDMLRILENGFSVYMAKTKYSTFAVDTPSDLKKVEKLLKKTKK